MSAWIISAAWCRWQVFSWSSFANLENALGMGVVFITVRNGCRTVAYCWKRPTLVLLRPKSDRMSGQRNTATPTLEPRDTCTDDQPGRRDRSRRSLLLVASPADFQQRPRQPDQRPQRRWHTSERDSLSGIAIEYNKMKSTRRTGFFQQKRKKGQFHSIYNWRGFTACTGKRGRENDVGRMSIQGGVREQLAKCAVS